MNTKRQTIWLVSMLSLMVVLSAYYLFTEDVNKLNTANEKVTQEDIKVTTEVKDPQAGDQAVNGGVTSSTSTTDAKATQTGAEKTDAQILETAQTSAKSGAGYFAELAQKRGEELGKLTEKYFDIIADPKKSTEEISKANNDLDKLQEKQEKIDNLESLLAKTYKNAIVVEEGNKFKAVVQAEKLDAKQASTIIELMIKELNVSKDVVSVQYMN